MKKILLLTMAVLLLAASIASAQVPTPQAQVLLPGSRIPQFVDPLPGSAAGDFEVIQSNLYTIWMREFNAQILPNAPINVGRGVVLPAGTPSAVWGYRTTAADAPGALARPTYLGPVVVATRGVTNTPTYENHLGGAGSIVQPNLPNDLTLDWALKTQIDCAPVLNPVTGLLEWTLAACGTLPTYTLTEVPAAVHLHGGEVAPAFDGGPDAWFTPSFASTPPPTPANSAGVAFPGKAYTYPNGQESALIWFHDHALGVTRLNVYAGLAGVHFIKDPANEPPSQAAAPAVACNGCLPNSAFDVPIIIQDRSFDTTGQLFYNLASNPQPNPTVHPFWIPEFIGDAIVVNGKTWPFLNVEPRQYRLRFLNGSNARFYDLSFPRGVTMTVIGTDGGYLDAPVLTPNLIIGPGERYDVIVNFAPAAGKNVILSNVARTPFPAGGLANPGTVGRIMQFRVAAAVAANSPADPVLPTNLRPNNPIVRLTQAGTPLVTPDVTRRLTLNEIIGPGGPLALTLNNTYLNFTLTRDGFSTRETELPRVGSTELWEIVNISADAHPIHTHLTTFQLVDRQPFNLAAYLLTYDALVCNLPTCVVKPGEGPPFNYNTPIAGAIGGNPAPALLGAPVLPLAYENGWKDTVIAYPGEVTRIMVRYAPTDTPKTGTACAAGCGLTGAAACTPGCVPVAGTNTYPFDPTVLAGGVGYVWHCHIIDHEDNEMMRGLLVMP